DHDARALEAARHSAGRVLDSAGGRRRKPGPPLPARLGLARRARRKRARWTDHRLDQKHVPAADGVLGGEVTGIPRGLRHRVHAVRDLEAAAELYRRLGFTVGARNQHSWGTHNHLVQLPGFFIELLTVAEPQKLGSDGFSALFGTFN